MAAVAFNLPSAFCNLQSPNARLFVARRCCETEAIAKGKLILEEIVKMLFTMLDRLGCRIAEDAPEFGEGAAEEVEEAEE